MTVVNDGRYSHLIFSVSCRESNTAAERSVTTIKNIFWNVITMDGENEDVDMDLARTNNTFKFTVNVLFGIMKTLLLSIRAIFKCASIARSLKRYEKWKRRERSEDTNTTNEFLYSIIHITFGVISRMFTSVLTVYSTV